MKKILFALLFLWSASAQAAEYKVDYAQSIAGFSGTHADNKFTGKFGTWTANINFDADHPEIGHIIASFDLATAKTGNPMYDGTLPEADWFDVKHYPKAEFVSTAIKANPDKTYNVTGNLTIRNITHPVTFDFTLTDPAKMPVHAKAQFTIDRLAYDLGKKSDDKGEWVDKNITITLDITATK